MLNDSIGAAIFLLILFCSKTRSIDYRRPDRQLGVGQGIAHFYWIEETAVVSMVSLHTEINESKGTSGLNIRNRKTCPAVLIKPMTSRVLFNTNSVCANQLIGYCGTIH